MWVMSRTSLTLNCVLSLVTIHVRVFSNLVNGNLNIIDLIAKKETTFLPGKSLCSL